jgi:hypothetical protein
MVVVVDEHDSHKRQRAVDVQDSVVNSKSCAEARTSPQATLAALARVVGEGDRARSVWWVRSAACDGTAVALTPAGRPQQRVQIARLQWWSATGQTESKDKGVRPIAHTIGDAFFVPARKTCLRAWLVCIGSAILAP